MKKVKVCGMREWDNILLLKEMKPDFMGFIFYSKSPRHVGEGFQIPELPSTIQKVGVFVNEPLERVVNLVERHGLEYVQLHSGESPDYCAELKKKGVKIVKAFAVDSEIDFEQLKSFENVVDYFLFDTKGNGYGGHGTSFNWKILERYMLQVPFFVAGGVSNYNVAELLELEHPLFFGIDVNSKYEISPGLKDIEALKQLLLKVRT